MPRIVNHDERRQTVAQIARRMILELGMDKVTVREVARQAGFSTAVVSHYFRDKKDLMLLVFRDAQAGAEARFRSAIDAGLPLLETLEALLPRDAQTQDTWRVWFAFWSLTLAHEDFRQEQVLQARKTVDMIAALLQQRGFPPAHAAAQRQQAQRLFALLSGMATQATHDPEQWPLDGQRRIIQAELDALQAAATT